jgi:hypothetical protein
LFFLSLLLSRHVTCQMDLSPGYSQILNEYIFSIDHPKDTIHLHLLFCVSYPGSQKFSLSYFISNLSITILSKAGKYPLVNSGCFSYRHFDTTIIISSIIFVTRTSQENFHFLLPTCVTLGESMNLSEIQISPLNKAYLPPLQ